MNWPYFKTRLKTPTSFSSKSQRSSEVITTTHNINQKNYEEDKLEAESSPA